MIKNKNVLFIAAIFVSSTAFCQAQLTDSQTEEIDTYIENTINALEIPGVAVAIVKDNSVVYKNYIGKANLEYNVPITDSSLFRLHSLSKIFVSVGIFQLIENGKISLEDKISMHLKDLPAEWQDIKIMHLLSHSSGLPDMRDETDFTEEKAKENIYSKPIEFPIGERASYNQTNFWLLNRTIRKITERSFQDHLSSQFDDESSVCYSNIADIIPNRVMEYKPDNNGLLKNSHFLLQDFMYGAAGITMSLDNLIEWDKKLNENVLITESSKTKMFTPFKYKFGKGFTNGWDVQKLNGIDSFGFNGGGLVNYRTFPDKNLSIIWFTNGHRRPHNIDRITNTLAGYTDSDLIDRTPEFSKALEEIIATYKSKEFTKKYETLKKEYSYVNFEQAINNLGYQFLSDKKTDGAIDLFKLNTEQYPESGNTFDSLAESYFVNKEFELSKKNYLKSLELNPSNSNATMMLKKIEEENQ